MKQAMIIILIICSLVVFAACSQTDNNEDAPSLGATSPADIEVDTPLEDDDSIEKEQLITAKSNHPYAKVIKDLWNAVDMGRVDTNHYTGTLYDLDGDGQQELILYYENWDITTACYQLWTMVDGQAKLVKDDKIFILAGGPTGGVSIVEFEGKEYFCPWFESQEEGTSREAYKLYTFENNSLILHDDFEFYFSTDYLGYDISMLDMEPFFECTRNGQAISVEEFNQVRSIFLSPKKYLVDIFFGSGDWVEDGVLRRDHKDHGTDLNELIESLD